MPDVLSLSTKYFLDIEMKKSARPDSIPNAFLWCYAEWITKYLLENFIASLQQQALS